MQASLRLAQAGPERRLPVQGLPDALAHRGRAGRHRRLARQHERGQLALPFLRHRQGQRLARRPGRDRVHVPRSAEGGVRARAHGHAVRPQPRRHDLPAPVRRPHRQLRREAGAARLRRGRPHRPRDAAHAVPAEREGAHDLLRRVDGARPDPRRRRRRARRHRARDGDRRGPHPRSQDHAVRHRRRRAHLRRFAPTPSSTPATAWAWPRAPACRSRTWSSGSSTRRACTTPACC